MLFSKRARTADDSRVAEAERAVAEANVRASEADQKAAEARERTAQIERLTTWRHIPNKEGFAALVRAIEPIAKSLDVLIEYERGDREATSYALEIVVVFVSAGVEKIRHMPNQMLENAFGLLLAALSEAHRQVIQDAFAAAGMAPLMIQADLSTHLPRNVPAPNAYIFVGAAPPPAFIAEALAEMMTAVQNTNATRDLNI